ncbi:hypothetical protein [Blastopirellula marina]|uniref:hypothetical protein n=1 Tax=Blastopirellula marina TaxID=124 RepID=UPI001304F96D|nr:hypothetical protein [Blastopirellula marina]
MIAESREEVERARKEVLDRDAMLLTLDVSEPWIVHKFANYLNLQFGDLCVDAECSVI